MDDKGSVIGTFENRLSRVLFSCLFLKCEVVRMAVKVIRYGKRRMVCTYCGSLLEYEKSDVASVKTGINEYESEIECPNCQEKIRIK